MPRTLHASHSEFNDGAGRIDLAAATPGIPVAPDVARRRIARNCPIIPSARNTASGAIARRNRAAGPGLLQLTVNGSTLSLSVNGTLLGTAHGALLTQAGTVGIQGGQGGRFGSVAAS
jgi:hypothetical protein